MKKPLLIFVSIFILYNARGQELLNGRPQPDGEINGIVQSGSTIYVGGTFTHLDTTARTYLGAFNSATGQVTSWNPVLSGGGGTSIYAMGIAGGKLIVGGIFDTVNNQPRSGICMFDISTGNLDNWIPNLTGFIDGIGIDGNSFYYIGLDIDSGFSRIYRVDATTGLTTWQSGSVFDDNTAGIARLGNYVYMGGNNTLVRYSVSTGNIDNTWNSKLPSGSFITCMVLEDGQLYIGGSYDSIAGTQRNGLASFNPDGSITDFDIESSSSQIYALFPDAGGQTIWVGGNSHEYGYKTRWRAAEINIASQLATCWDPSFISSQNNEDWFAVDALYVNGDTTYAAPVFGGLAIFIDNPRPHLHGNIGGAVNVIASQKTVYSVPDSTSYSYTWGIIGGTGTSYSDSIAVTWGAGPSGTVYLIESNINYPDCVSDTFKLQVNISSNGLDELSNVNNFSIYPNPSSGKFIVSLTNPASENSLLKITDISGRVISIIPIERNKLTYEVNTYLPAGIYLLTFESETGTTCRKLVTY